MIEPARLQELLPAYAEEAKLFFYQYGLANLVVDVPVDHVAIKALNREVYEDYLKVYASLSKTVTYAHIDDRDLATAELFEPMDAGTFGHVQLIEIMEPRPNTIATTHDLIDHIELLVDDLAVIKKTLEDKEVKFSEQSNVNHNTIAVEINEWGQEVKFTDRSLLKIREIELADGTAKALKTND